MEIKFLKLSFLLIILTFSSVSCLSEMQIKIQPKDSETIESREINSNSFNTRADSDSNFFLIFFDKDPQICDQQAYINIAAEKGSVLKPGFYEDAVGSDSDTRSKALLDFYYTEPKGLRFHCLDNLQKGSFTVKEVLYNQINEVKSLNLELEIHCIKDGVVDKRGVKGSLVYDEDDMVKKLSKNLKFLSE